METTIDAPRTDGRTTAGRFTPGIAKQFSDLAVAAHKRNARNRAERLAEPPKDFLEARLTHVRAHIVRLDKKLSTARDPLACERLARALTALSEQERELAGRPKAGQLRPTAPVKERVKPGSAMIE